ncbi:MAG: restriction endonuclease subunit S [Saprospiraceae bacterium]|nr:restriction endonuclease subunit S [Saprospiraceae bacterium]
MIQDEGLRLPNGWELKKLGEVCDTGAGGTPLKAHKDYYEGGTIPWLMSGEVSQGEVFEAKNYITEKGLRNSSAKLFPINTVLVAMYGATAGQVGILKLEACTNQAVCGILPNEKTIPEYLFYCFLSKKQDLVAQAVGGAQPNISQIKIRNTKIPLPPLPEQQRIVAILDKAFAAIAKAKANAEQNLKNAKQLFESYLQGVFENGDWEFVKLSEMATDISDGDHMPPPKSEFGLPFITISNINKQTHKIDFSATFKVPEKYYDDLKPNKKPIKGDVLYTVTGSYGIPVLIEDDFRFCFQRHIGLIRPSKKLDSKLLYYWILSPQAISQANETATGTAQKTVSLKSLRNFNFPYIPFKEQQTIVRQLDALRAETQKLESVYQKKIEDLEELKKSILQKAFAGELKIEKLESVN